MPSFPPLPPAFGPDRAPVGVGIHWFTKWAERPVIRCRGLLVHTNAASRPASLSGTYNYGNIDGNTKPHYQVQMDGTAEKFLPSDRKGTANYRADDFFLSIETQDMGYPTPGDVRWTPAQAEVIATIIAFEAITNQFPIETPKAWDGTGVGAHTDPFTYPYWTKHQGKTCPGAWRKAQLRDEVMPRARAIKFEWQNFSAPNPPEEDEDVATARRIFKPPAGSPGGWPWIVEFSNGYVRPLVSDDPAGSDTTVSTQVLTSLEQYLNLAHAAGCAARVA
jgi:hypothetical protein